jgi:hypothetical protein
MWYRKWLFLNQFFSPKLSSSRKKLPNHSRKFRRSLLALESLEDRVVPATITWSNPNGGAWDVGSNWVGGAAPGSGDTAVIDTTSAATITISSSSWFHRRTPSFRPLP